MKKALSLIISLLIAASFVLTSCNNDIDSESGSPSFEESNTSVEEASTPVEDESSEVVMTPDENAKKIWQDSFADANAGINGADDVYNLTVYNKGEVTTDLDTEPASGDVKYVFGGKANTRIINYADGYMLSFPGAEIETNLKLAELRVQYKNENSILTLSKETSNPYGNTENGWNTYLTEWLNRFIDNADFLAANSINRTRKAATYEDFLPGYTVMFYDMFIRLSKQIERPYYNIAIVRENGVYNKFWLFVMKSTEKSEDAFDRIVKSFKEIEPQGKAVNSQGQYNLTVPEYWNDETKAYFEKLCNQNTCDWGMFVRSMPSEKSSSIKSEGAILEAETERLSTAMNYDFDIMPTYMHIGWGNELHYFPMTLANTYAGGNGFNGKPVLQFTYQFTTLNNGNLDGFSPMFNIIRGNYDRHFRKLAQDVKAYGKPVLFRLCNEMNTDWTSYCGMITLCDPDIFVMAWERLYNIFLEEGVDNCIWIFNPIAKSTPYSSWGEALCYMPDEKCVQALGLTYYEMGNGTSVESFKDMYSYGYNTFDPYYDAFPWIISEFACGSGGERLYDWGIGGYKNTVLRRNAKLQAKWVKEMFDCFEKSDKPGYEFAKKIKGAVWFCVNDYASIDGNTYIINNLRIDPELTDTIECFRDGLARTHQ